MTARSRARSKSATGSARGESGLRKLPSHEKMARRPRRRTSSTASSSQRTCTKSNRSGGRHENTSATQNRSAHCGRRRLAGSTRPGAKSMPYGSIVNGDHSTTDSMKRPLAQPTSRNVPPPSTASTIPRRAASHRSGDPWKPDCARGSVPDRYARSNSEGVLNTARDLPAFGHDVEAGGALGVLRVRGQPRLGGLAQTALLLDGHHLHRLAQPHAALRLDLAEDQRSPAPQNQVELVAADPGVPREHAIAEQPVAPGGAALGLRAATRRGARR